MQRPQITGYDVVFHDEDRFGDIVNASPIRDMKKAEALADLINEQYPENVCHVESTWGWVNI